MSATFVIQIKADGSGVTSATRQVGAELDKVKQKALDVNSAMRSIFGIYALKEVFTGLMNLANGYQAVQNKIRTITDSQANLNGVMSATFKVAQDTRTSWDSTTIMYQRLALNSKTLGASQKELIDFTKHLNEEVIVSGATSKEASSGIIQLAQGMAAGRLHGQDLRAVMEDLPGVVDVIAKHFNTTRGALYQMGSQGKITSQEILKAFAEAGSGIDKAFGDTLPTISQSIEMVRNAAEKFFGEAGTGSGLLAGLAAVLKFVADHFDTIGKIVLAVVQTLGGLLIITKVIGWFQALSAVIMAAPLTAFITLVVGAVMVLRQFGDEISSAGNSTVSVGDQLRALWEMFKQVTSAIGSFISDGWNELKAAFSDGVSLDGIDLTLGNAVKLFAAFVLSVKSIITHLKDIIVEIFGGVPAVLAEKFDESFHSVVVGITAVVNKIIAAINAIHSLTDNSVQDAYAKASVIEKRYNALIEKFTAANEVYTSGVHFIKTPFGQDVPAFKDDSGQVSPGVLSAQTSSSQEYANKKATERMAQIQAEMDKIYPQLQAAYQAVEDAKAGNHDFIPQLEFDSAGLKGAGAAFKKDLKDTADDIRSDVVLGLAEFDKLSKDISAKRLANKPGSTIHDASGTAAIPPPTSAEIAARNKLIEQLDQLIKRGTPYEAAMQKIADANKILSNSMAQDILSTVFGTNAAAVLGGIEEKLRPITDMFGELINKTIERAAAMKGSREEEELTLAVEQELDKLRQNGTAASTSQANEIRRVTALAQDRNRVWREEQKILDEVSGPEKQYVLTLRAINKALDDQAINQHQANMAREQAARTLLNAGGAAAGERGDLYSLTKKSIDPDALTHGFDDGINHVMQSMLNLSATVSDAMTNTFQSLEKNILSAVETGKFAWDDLANTAVQELNKIALKLLETWLLTTLLNTAFGSPVASVAGAVTGGGPGTAAGLGGVLAGATNGGAHASGGSYVVPGTGGLDSRSVMFQLTPGERVDFTPPGRSVARGGTTLGPRGRGVTEVEADGRKGGSHTSGGRGSGVQMVVIDGRSILPALMTPDGQRAIMQVIANNPNILKGIK